MSNRNILLSIITLLAGLSVIAPAFSFEGAAQDHDAIVRISPEEARSKAQAGTAILVCAYKDERCEGKMLDGALTRREFEEKMPSLSKEQEIIIYCA
jgi:hypothetical protein